MRRARSFDTIVPMNDTYTATAKWFHWVIVILFAVELLIGALMPDIHRNTPPSSIMTLHFSFGLTIIAVMLLRLLWRIFNRPPALPSSMPRWQIAASHATHMLLYVLLALIPLAGWLWANSLGFTVQAFWLVTIPTLVPASWAYGRIAAGAHVFLIALVCGLIALHVLAALYHHIVHKNGVFERMLPNTPGTKKLLAYLESLYS